MALPELFANDKTTTLSAAIVSTGATTLTVASSTGFPAAATAGGQFRIRIDDELMIVTNVSGTTWTVTRGAESTTATTHSSGATVSHVLTAAAVQVAGPTVAARIRPTGTSQSIPNNTVTTIVHGTTVFDHGGLITATVDTLVVPAGKAGLWLLVASVEFTGNATGIRTLQVVVNGAVVGDNGAAGSSSGNRLQTLTATVLAVGDLITESVYQNSGGSLSTSSDQAFDTYLLASYIGPVT